MRPPHLLLRHVKTTAVRAGGGAGISPPLVWLSCVCTVTFTLGAWSQSQRWQCHDQYLVCLPFLFPSPPLSGSIIPLLLVLTRRDLCWLWQGCHSDECAAWRVSCQVGRDFCRGVLWRWVVALGEVGLNAARTVSPGWWKNAKRFTDGVQQINRGNAVAREVFFCHKIGGKKQKWCKG